MYTPGKFINTVYIAIHRSGEFVRDCEKFKQLPVASRSTEAQIRAFFLDCEIQNVWRPQTFASRCGYCSPIQNYYSTSKTNKLIADLQDQFVAHSATANAYQKVIDREMIDWSAACRCRCGCGWQRPNFGITIIPNNVGTKLNNTLLQAIKKALSTNLPSSTIGGGGGSGCGCGHGRVAGQGCGHGGTGGCSGGKGCGGTYWSASDEPIGTIKTTKYWGKNDHFPGRTDVISHHSTTEAITTTILLGMSTGRYTSDNPASGASTKDREFLKWANVNWPWRIGWNLSFYTKYWRSYRLFLFNLNKIFWSYYCIFFGTF